MREERRRARFRICEFGESHELGKVRLFAVALSESVRHLQADE